MPLSEADTRAKLIDPALHRCGWTEDLIRQEETEKGIYVAEYYGAYLRDAKKEFSNVILLDIKNKPVHNIEISKGSINASIVDPKEIIKEATLKSASSIILVHNHPSGDKEPSADDIKLTNKIIDACNIVGIKVLDHIIIGKNREDYYSFTNQGLIK